MDLQKRLFPPRLKIGQSVAIVSPAGCPNPNQLVRGVKRLTQAGLSVKLGRYIQKQHGYLAGDDRERAEDFNTALRDPDTRAIFCSRGGYGSSRILPLIDYHSVLSDPKIICGFSDITSLLNAITSTTGLITFHGPMLSTKLLSDPSFHFLLDQLMRPDSQVQYEKSQALNHSITLREGTVSGLIYGGCLSVFCTLIGTTFFKHIQGMILFFEDIAEPPYKIDRLLIHLRNSGIFQSISGLVFGQFVNCRQKRSDQEPSLSIGEIIADIFKDYSFPMIANASIGHIRDNLTIPIGARFTIHSNRLIQNEYGVS